MSETATLKLADLPSPDDEQAVFAFAMSFNGYEEFGSLQAAATAAREQRRSSLSELRNELFFVARASRHSVNKGFVNRYRELLPSFQRLLGD
jgi:hypothetical protein